MIKRQVKNYMKLISQGGYVFAFVIPLISFPGETKASTKLIATVNKASGFNLFHAIKVIRPSF